MLFERQRVLLTLLDAPGGDCSPADFQKLLFFYKSPIITLMGTNKPPFENHSLLRAVFAISLVGLAICLLAVGTVPTHASEATLASETHAPVMIQGRKAGTIKLPAGSKLAVVAASEDTVTVRWGSMEPFELPISLVVLPSATPADAADIHSSTPESAPVQEPHLTPLSQSSSVPEEQPSPSPDRDQDKPSVELMQGWNTVQFPELPTPGIKPSWFRYDFDASSEKFLIYLPKNHDPAKPYGVIGWTNPGDQLGIPNKFESLFDEFGLIAIAAERCGNKQATDRRAGLLVSGIMALSQSVPIDSGKVFASGFSGGGRVSALACFVHPEFFRGAISWCGGNFYKDYPSLKKANYVYYGISRAHDIPDAVTRKNITDARRNARFVLITGEADSNYENSLSIEAAMEEDGFNVRLIDEPGLGHSVGSPESMRQALDFVLAR